ncbi:hypothetical protein ACEPAG_6907 [Sanghuangporus baumii]
MSDAGSIGAQEQYDNEERYVPRGPSMTSPMSDYPTQALLKATLTVEDEAPGTPYEPTSWWGARGVIRPWREKPELKRRDSAPPEQVERWTRTKNQVSHALRSTLDYGLDATHDLLEISADVLRFAPIPGLEEAARVLLTIWDSLQLVETNRMACLRLTERCADILLAVREDIHEAGDQIGEELKVPMQKLVEAFKSVHVLLQKQVHRPFLKRYLKRDDILRNINGCDAALSDALSLFSMSIQIRTLRQLQAAEAQRKADTDRLIASLTPQQNKVDVDIDATPKQKSRELPPDTAPPPYTKTVSGNTDSSSKSGSLTNTSSTISSGKPVVETVQSPPPTPDSHLADVDASQLTIHAAPSPEEVREQLAKIVEQQNTIDHALDLADLRVLMREALATSSDAEMLRVLQVNREDIAEAMKTLQRALEKERQKEEEAGEVNAETARISEESIEAGAESTDKPGALGLTGLRRRLTMDSVTTRTSKKSKNSKTDGRTTRQSVRSDRDTLDREFIETGIDALRRLSRGQDINLPNWTITRYEIDMEAKVGVGYFSDVYRARWRERTVAVKVLTLTTPKKLFIHEMEVWKSLDHPNVLPLLGASSAMGDPPWFLVSTFMENGNLVEYLRSSKKPIDAVVERRLIYEVAKGMAYLHRQGVMHGDLKGTNVLIDDKGHCRITDFGQSEMKSEAFRISGSHPPRGTLRWQAPEIIDGASSGRLTYQVDIYAYAIVCVEIFGHGALPWGVVDDDAYRRLVVEEDKRPPITSSNANKGILSVIEMCWTRDPTKRPTFQKVVRELRNLGLNKYSDSPRTQVKVIDSDSKRSRPSPDMRPVDLPDVESDDHDHLQSTSARSSPGPIMFPHRSHALSVGAIPIQRIITPIREEDKSVDSKSASPVDYRPIRLPETFKRTEENGLHAREVRVRSKSEGSTPARQESTSTSNTSSSNTNSYTDGPGLVLERVESPPPADEVIAQRKNESRYRLCLQHTFHPSLTLALWDPAPVCLGAVGYLLRPEGQFVTLFNAFDPPKSSQGLCEGMPNVHGYGRVEKGSQRKDARNVTQRGLDIIQGLLWFRSRTSGDYQQNVNRRISFPIRAGHKSAYLYVEQTLYRYIADLAAPKRWFEANIDRILSLYAKEHRLQKEDVFLVVGTLDAPDYGLFVNHNNPDGQVHFNVYASPKTGQKWGAFAVDTNTLPASLGSGPSWHEEVPGRHASANKVSEVSPSRPWDTVLLARLRFRPDDDHSTAV